MKGFLAILALGCLVALAKAVPAGPCPPQGSDIKCELPDCLCSSQNIPKDLPRTQTPQMVFLTFDDAINVVNYPFYEQNFFNRTNPNGAPITLSYFVTHEYNDYSLVHQLWRQGHDIALHSITHQTNTNYWKDLSEAEWRAEFVDQREQMSTFAAIPQSDIQGMRAPFLQTGGNVMYKALSEGGFTWECSRPTWNQRTPGLWPYTNDFASTQDCQIAPCPTDEFKGFWTVPMIDLIGEDFFPCAMLDQCNPVPTTATATFEFLKRNFLDQYMGNRAPFGVYTHAAFLVGDEPGFAERREGYKQFLDYLKALTDVYIVSVSKGLEWMKNPTVLSEINEFVPWQAPAEQPANQCAFPRSCRYTIPAERYMQSCVVCPPTFPWLHNPLGLA